MARNDTDTERILREHFAAEAADLRAPAGLWERLEGRLGEQDAPSRLAALRGGAGRAFARARTPLAAAAVIAAIGIGVAAAIWATAGFETTGDDNDAIPAASEADASAMNDGEAPVAAATAAATAAPRDGGAAADAAMPEAAATSAASCASCSMAVPDDASAGDADAAGTGMLPDGTSPSSVGAASKGGGGSISFDRERADVPQDTTFRDYGRQPFVETASDPVSTFSLDVDRTSYQLALTWARAGYAVDPDSVRAEEWGNAFDYGYARPAGDADFAITSELVGHPLDAGKRLARIAFQAPDARDDAPLNVTLVLDASGSMEWEDRVAIARAAAEAIRQSLTERDRIAVVHFTTDVIYDLTVGHSRPSDMAVRRSIARLEPHDSTNVQAGLDLGARLAERARRERPEAHNYVILMSDGVANVDATDPFAILESTGRGERGNPLRLIAIGVGIHNYNDYLLEQLAQHGDGWYRYLNDTEQAARTFSRANWLALSTPFADQTRAQVRWDPAVVKAWRILGYENRVTPDHTFEQDRREFAEIPAGTATTVFYELELADGVGDGAGTRLGEVELRWVDPRGGESFSRRADVTGRADAAFAEADARLRLGAIAALAADRYAGLVAGEGVGLDPAAVRDGLARLRVELNELAPALGGLTAWRDLAFLLGALSESAAALASPEESGYSR